MKHDLTFSTNWNKKLDCDYFTTLRLSGRMNVGDLVEVTAKGYNFLAEVVEKKQITLDMIDNFIAFVDTGYNAEETQKIIRTMYKDITDWNVRPVYRYLLGKKKHGKKT